jgi:hypothetical protein
MEGGVVLLKKIPELTMVTAFAHRVAYTNAEHLAFRT